MKFFILIIIIIIFNKIVYAANLFETKFYDIEFVSNSIQEQKILEINRIKISSIKSIFKKILNEKNFNTMKPNLSEDLVNSFIKNIIINDEKIINNKYVSKLKINYDKKIIVNYLRRKKIPYVEYFPRQFLLLIYEEDGFNKNLFSLNNKHYEYFLNNLHSQNIFQIPNLDINDRFILKAEDIKNKNLKKIINFSDKYENDELIIIYTKKNKNIVNYDLLIFSNKEILEKKLSFNEYNYEKFFKLLENISIDSWKQINQIQNDKLNIINCEVNYYNLYELKEIKKNFNNISIIQKLNINNISYKKNEYKIQYFGNKKILYNLLLLNNLNIKNSENLCNIRLK